MLQVIYIDHALRKGWKLSTYRTEAGAEVDLIIERGADVVAVEVKASRQVSPRDVRGLLSLEQLVGPKRRLTKLLLYRGSRPQRFESGVEAWPVAEGLRRIASW